MREKLAIFGTGRVATAMVLEMQRAGHNPRVVKRGEDCDCDLAIICWPAQEIKNFWAECPRGTEATKVSFCNGVWSRDDGADQRGICYVRAAKLGDVARPGDKCWRVGGKDVARVLSEHGLGVIHSKMDHESMLWQKALYLLPLALACADEGKTAKEVVDTESYRDWYQMVRGAAILDIGRVRIEKEVPRVKYLVERTPKDWTPSPSEAELEYFRQKIFDALEGKPKPELTYPRDGPDPIGDALHGDSA